MYNYVLKCENDGDHIGDFDAFKIALETRNFEIGLFWQRSNYFLVLNTALAIGYFRFILGKEQLFLSILIAFLGVIASWCWLKVNLGSKYWQNRWEYRLKLMEEKIDSELNFFSASKRLIQCDVMKSYKHDNSKKNIIQRCYKNQILKKPSVSYYMTVLSFVFVVCWLLLLMYSIYEKFPIEISQFVSYTYDYFCCLKK